MPMDREQRSFDHLQAAEEYRRLAALRARIDARLRTLADRVNPDAPPFQRLGRLALIAALAEGGQHG